MSAKNMEETNKKPLTQEQIKELWNKYGIDPDKELLEWERWVRIRKEEAMHLAKHTDRPPVDLAMNLLECFRETREWKITMEHAQLEKKLGLRSSLWEAAPRLPQSCICQPVYEVHRTPADIGIPPVIEHVTVPHEIQVSEKGLIGDPGRRTDFKLNEEFHRYKKRRELELEEKIKKIDPYGSDKKNLMIKGNAYHLPPPPVPPLPLISISQFISGHEIITSVYAFRINNTLIIKDIPRQDVSYLKSVKTKYLNDPCTTWSYYFNVPVNKVGRNKIYLENYGTVTLRYMWKRIKHPIPFIPNNMDESVFFFNKNEDVLSPGQNREVFFTFISDKPGIFQEHWELSTCNINFFDNHSERLVINLYSDCTEDLKLIKSKFLAVKDYIKQTNVEYFIREILFDPVEKAPVVEPLIYPYNKMLSEAEMFLLKNPVCYYHQSEVENLKNMYIEFANMGAWNLAISSWREKMMKEPYDDRMRLYDVLKTSFKTMLRPWSEESDVLSEKYRAVKMLLGMLADKIDNEYHRIYSVYFPRVSIDTKEKSLPSIASSQSLPINITINNLFGLYVYEHVVNTMEQIAGLISSIDLNRHIKFDFCK